MANVERVGRIGIGRFAGPLAWIDGESDHGDERRGWCDDQYSSWQVGYVQEHIEKNGFDQTVPGALELQSAWMAQE